MADPVNTPPPIGPPHPGHPPPLRLPIGPPCCPASPWPSVPQATPQAPAPAPQALHDAAARNKTFEVCSEVAAEAGTAYELVAHLPDHSNNYLTPALVGLEKNTA